MELLFGCNDSSLIYIFLSLSVDSVIEKVVRMVRVRYSGSCAYIFYKCGVGVSVFLCTENE